MQGTAAARGKPAFSRVGVVNFPRPQIFLWDGAGCGVWLGRLSGPDPYFGGYFAGWGDEAMYIG